MAEPQLLVTPDDVMSRVGVDPEDTDLLLRAKRAILDAQADVEGYIRRGLFPVERTLPSVYPVTSINWGLGDVRAWPDVLFMVQDVFTVVSSTPNGDGSFQLVVNVGLDGLNESPIVRFVTRHAAETLRNDPVLFNTVQKRVKSVSAEGQSLTYELGSMAEGDVGAPPKLSSLARYRIPSVYTSPTPPTRLWGS